MFGIEAASDTSTGIDRGTYGGKSLVLDGSADYLSMTPSASNRDTWTFSCWAKLSGLSQVVLFSAGAGSSNHTKIMIETSTLTYKHVDVSVNTDIVSGTGLLRDPHTFYHIVVAVDTTQGTAADRIKLYVNGVEVTYSNVNYPSSGVDTDVNSASAHEIGRQIGGSNYLDGYISKVDFIDGQQLTPSSFGHESPDTDKWVASDTSGLTFGTNGFSLDFNDDRASTPDTTTTIYDQANSNDWTGNSLVAGSFTGDTPVDNYATMNPLDFEGNPSFSSGNLDVSITTSASTEGTVAGVLIDASDADGFYCEMKMVAGTGNGPMIGFIEQSERFNSIRAGDGVLDGGFLYRDGTAIEKRQNGSNSSITGAATPADGDTAMLAIKNGKCWIGHNGTWQGTSADPAAETGAAFTNLSGKYYIAVANTGTSTINVIFNFGATDYTYTKPTGFKDVSSANLPVPDALYRKPQNFADILLYTGNGTAIGSGGQTISGLSFTPDFAWFKDRTTGNGHNWFDRVRGATNYLRSDTTGVETTNTETLDSFTSDGGVVGSSGFVNTNTDDYWSLWLKADNTSGSSNTDGSITSTVATDGINFSIVTYTGTGANATVGHGLASAPDMIIVKNRDSAFNWPVYHSSNTSAPETDRLLLNVTDATGDSATVWNDTSPASSVFSVGTNVATNELSSDFVAYCFVFGDVFAGGSYTGNGDADGTFIPTDELLLWLGKRTDAANDWYLHDQLRSVYDPREQVIYPNLSNAEATSSAEIDILSNGIKHRANTAALNSVSGTYIWWGIKKNGGSLSA